MNKILVLYHSRTGNTAKMAGHVAEGAGAVPDTEVRLRSIEEAVLADVLWCDGVAVGCPTNFGTISWPMKKFWDEVPFDHWLKIDGKLGCAFSSSGGWGGGTELTCMAILTVLMNYGFLVFGVTEYSGKLKTAHYGAIVAKEPREPEDIEACRLLGRRLAEWVAVYIGGDRSRHPLAGRKAAR